MKKDKDLDCPEEFDYENSCRDCERREGCLELAMFMRAQK